MEYYMTIKKNKLELLLERNLYNALSWKIMLLNQKHKK